MRPILLLIVVASIPHSSVHAEKVSLSGSKPLKMTGDIASTLVDGVDRFLLRETSNSVARRESHWQRDFSSPEAYAKSIEKNRERLNLKTLEFHKAS